MSDYVLIKRGLYYRPDARGYTGVLAEAGRYSQEQAQALVDHCGGEVTMLPAHDAYPFSPACWPETKIKMLEAEAERLRADAEDAARFRALMRCGRIKPQGSAGVHPLTGGRKHPESPGAVHFGAEFWVQPEEVLSPLTVWGRHCLRALADDILAFEAARPTPPLRTEGEG